MATRFAGQLSKQDSLLGYLIKPPAVPMGLHVALDGEGRIIGRSRKPDDLVEVVTNHIRTRGCTPPGPGLLRLRFAALVDDDRSISLLGPSVGQHPGFSERQLARHGLRLIDSSYVDLDIGCRFVGANRPAEDRVRPRIVGHVSLDEVRGTVDRLVLRNVDGGNPFTTGLVACELARATRSGTRAERLAGAVSLASELMIAEVSTSAAAEAISAVSGSN